MISRMSPAEVQAATEVVVVDVREYPEFAAGAIPGSRLVPLSALGREAPSWEKNKHYVMVCKSGKRSEQAARALIAAGFSRIALLDGGMDAWMASGLPVHRSESPLWSLERQVRIVAGAMVVVSAVLGITVSVWFLAWTLFVGAGLIVAGLTDTCMMASLLGRMPWNRRPDGSSFCPS